MVLLPSNRYLLHDSARHQLDGTVDLSCGIITPLEGFPSAIEAAFLAIKVSQTGSARSGTPSGMKLDGGTSLVVSADIIGEVVRCIAGEFEKALAVDARGVVKKEQEQ